MIQRIGWALICLALFPNPANAQQLRVPLSEAFNRKMVIVRAVATGDSYKKQGLSLELENRTGSQLRVEVDPGTIFRPVDTANQPLVLLGGEAILVAPWKSAPLRVQTFCANSQAMAPGKADSFVYAGVSGDTMVQLLKYLKGAFLLDELGQKAIWVLTNDHPLSEAYDPHRVAQSEKLIAKLMALTGKEQPEYYRVTGVREGAGQPVYSPKVLRIVAQFEEQFSEPHTLSLGVYNDQGSLIQSVFKDRFFGKTGHRFKVDFEAGNVPAGKYYIRLTEGDAVLQQKEGDVE